MILEDDADWHINIKEQFSLLSKGLLSNGAPISPRDGGEWAPKKQGAGGDFLRPYGKWDRYLHFFALFPPPLWEAYARWVRGLPLRCLFIGRGWEVLIFGQLWSEWQVDEPIRPGFTYRDTAGPKPDWLQEDFLEEMALHGIEDSNENLNMRVVAQAAELANELAEKWGEKGFIGLTGYAITRDAAQKLLYRVGIVPSDSAVDIQLRDMAFLCEIDTLVITPPLVFPWRIGGPGDTDIQEDLPVVDGIGEGSVRREMRRRWGGPDYGLSENGSGESPVEGDGGAHD
ncbi:MAG: hypothetical protein M1839_002434 [Geoglossum umbratile]|nr:MAG: hypothetical protein M1839_002434 [Geoglossum umbratile]